MDGRVGAPPSSASYRPTKRLRRNPAYDVAGSQDAAGRGAEWVESAARAVSLNTKTPVAWSRSNLIAVACPPQSTTTTATATESALVVESAQSQPRITVQHLSGLTAPRKSALSFELDVPVPVFKHAPLDSLSPDGTAPRHKHTDSSGQVSLLSFSPDSAYLLAVSSTDNLDLITVWEQGSSSCINEWDIVWSERADRFGQALDQARQTGHERGSIYAEPRNDSVKRVVTVKWLGEQKDYTVAPETQSGKPLTSVPSRSPPVNGAAFVAVLSTQEAMFVHLPRSVPLVPLTAVVPLSPATAQTELAVTALPTPSTYAAMTANPLGTSPNNAMDALVANLVDGMPTAGPSPNSLTTSITLGGAPSGSDALREQLKLAEASEHVASPVRQVVLKAAIGASHMSFGAEKGETTFIIATHSRLARNPFDDIDSPSNLLSKAASAAAAAAAAAATAQTVPNPATMTAASSPDDFSNDFADFSALDEAFGTTAKPSPANDAAETQAGQQDGNDETVTFEEPVKKDSIIRLIDLTELKIEMMLPDGPRVIIRQLPPVHLSDPSDTEGTALLRQLGSIHWIERNVAEMKDGATGLSLLAVATTAKENGQVESSAATWTLSNEPLALSSAFSKLDCKKSDAAVGAKEWVAQKAASTSIKGLVNILSTNPFPTPQGVACSIMNLSPEGRISNAVRLLDLNTLLPLGGFDDVAVPNPRAIHGCLSPNGALALLCSTDTRSAPVLVPTPMRQPNAETLGLMVAASLARQVDQSDLIGRIVALKDEKEIVSVIYHARDLLQNMLPSGRMLENSALAFELMGVAAAAYRFVGMERRGGTGNSDVDLHFSATPSLALRGEIALDVIKLAATCRAFQRCEVKARGSAAGEYACESDPVWSLIGYASWCCDFALSLAQECSSASSQSSSAPRDVLLLCSTTRSLLLRATEYILSFKAFLNSFPLHQNSVVDTAKTVLDDVVDFSGLNLVEFRSLLTKLDAAMTEEDSKGTKHLLYSLALPDSNVSAKLSTAFSSSSSNLFLPNLLPTPPQTPYNSSVVPQDTSVVSIDFIRKSRLAPKGDFKLRTDKIRSSSVMGRLSALMRDTFFGQVVYHASGERAFTHPEEQDDFKVPAKYLPENEKRKHSIHQGEKSTKNVKGNETERQAEEGRVASDDSSSDATAVHSRDSDQDQDKDHIVDWYGPDDPENPMNWSAGRKSFVTGCLCLMTTSVYAGSSIYTPGLMGAMQDLGVGQVPASLGLSLFVIGYAIGPLVLSPITEIPAIGRTAPYILTLAIYCALQVPAALTNSPAAFFIVRFLQGFFGSPPLATGGASVSDMFEPATRPYALGAWGLSAAAGPALGPVMSGFAIQYKNWHWHAWIMLWLSGFSLVFLIFALPETSSINILVRRARRLRKKTGNQQLKSQGEIEQQHMTGKDILFMTLVRPLQFTFTEPIVIALNLYITFVYVVLYAWFESFPLVFEIGYRWQLGISTLPFLSLLVGSVIGYSGLCVWNRIYFVPRFRAAEREGRMLAPEHRLPPAFVGSVCYPICLFWFAWSANRTSWVAPVIATSFFGIGTTLMFMGVLSYLPDAYPKYVASVLASNDFQRSMIGGVTPLFAGIMFKKLGIDWGSSLLGFVSVALVPIPFVLFKYGHKIREKSKMAEAEN
ncbi:GTPase-activating protein [Microbotryomycetes sp. JL201]|nr:GTPase-activating protein [Microbotryomycetes sp. JL201]